MKMHRNLAEAASALAKNVFRQHVVLDQALAELFESTPRWGKRDRSFIAETVFEVVRWKRALSFVADSEEIDALCAAQWVRMGYPLPEWWTYRGASADDMRQRELELADQPRAVRESVPDWLDELGEQELGEAWSAEITALNQRASVYLRVNTLIGDSEMALVWLSQHGVSAEAVAGVPNALRLPYGKMLPKALRLDGRVEIQDAGSQLIAPMLEPLAGERVIDACAGAGGKSLHLAALMGNEGRVFAMDVAGKKLVELERRAKRAQATCVKTKPITDTTPEEFAEVADRLLIDAPCSGLGTLRRQPDLKWRLRPGQFERLRKTQADLLEHYPTMLKPGGTLVYATCSILPCENRARVDQLLESGNFELLRDQTISPAETGFDGFYAAALKKLK